MARREKRSATPVRSATVRDIAGRAGVSVGSVSRALNGHGGLSERTRERVRRAASELDYNSASLRPAASPRPLLSDIALRAGVSIGSVSRALKGLGGVSNETRRRILQAAGDLGYDTENLRSVRIARVGVLVHRGDNALSNNLFYAPVLHGAEATCRAHKLAVAYSMVGPEDNLRELVVYQQVDALLCIGYFEPGLLAELGELGKPAVLVDHAAPGFSSVNSDNFGGAYAATRHLLSLGRRRVAFIGGQREHPSIQERRRGYERALADAGLARPGLDVTRDPPEREEGAEAAMRALLALAEPPDAVFAFNDATAAAAMRTCQAAGLRVPENVAFVGFDDITTAAYLRPPLSTVRVPKETLGARGAQLLLELQERADAVNVVVPTELIVRASSGAGVPARRRVSAGASRRH